jgi:hypothetical protein
MARAASAQAPPASLPADRAWLGSIAFAPQLAILDAGIDSNILNERVNPKSDTTATFRHQLEVWSHLGTAAVYAKGVLDLVYFKEYANQRSMDTDAEIRMELPFNRIRPYVRGSFVRSRSRVGYEIDERVRRFGGVLDTGATVRVTGKTSVRVSAQRAAVTYGEEATAEGIPFRQLLDRNVDTFRMSARLSVTPLTTLLLDGDLQRSRFESSPGRDSDSTALLPGIELRPFAVLSGRAQIGYRALDLSAPGLPDFRGTVAFVDLSYRLLGRTRFSIGGDRDVSYSYDSRYPLYVLTAITGSVTHRISERFDVEARAGRQRLEYEPIASIASTLDRPRVDRGSRFGGGVGYLASRTVRVGIKADYQRRRSDVLFRRYEGFRLGTFVTFGR